MNDLASAQWMVAALAAVLAGCAVLIGLKPTGEKIDKLPRAKIPGVILTLICWTWVTLGLLLHPIDLLAFLTPTTTIIGGIVCAVASCLLLENLLCARAVGGLMMLWPMPVIVAVRDQITLWRLIPVSVGYVSLTLGMFIVFYPWIFRKICSRLVAHKNLRIATAIGFLVAAVLTVICLTSLGKVIGE